MYFFRICIKVFSSSNGSGFINSYPCKQTKKKPLIILICNDTGDMLVNPGCGLQNISQAISSEEFEMISVENVMQMTQIFKHTLELKRAYMMKEG